MEYYKKARVDEIEEPNPFAVLIGHDLTIMFHNDSVRLHEVLDNCISYWKVDGNRKLLLTGVGNLTDRAITCAELLKRKFDRKGSIHQLTSIGYKKVEELWLPDDSRLDSLKVIREVPTIYLLLSKDPVDGSSVAQKPLLENFVNGPNGPNGQSRRGRKGNFGMKPSHF